MEHTLKNPYAVVCTAGDLKTSGRRAETARLILSGYNKEQIIAHLTETFGMERKQAMSEWKQGYTYIYLLAECTKEEIRQLSLARLEELFDRAEQDSHLVGKDYYNVQMKNIDTTSKVAGLYMPDTTVQAVLNDFTITIGAKSEDNAGK